MPGIYKKLILLKFCIFFVLALSVSLYGNLVESNQSCKVCWTGSTYEVKFEDPIPEKKGNVEIWAAKNKTESFQLVLTPLHDIGNIAITVSDFS